MSNELPHFDPDGNPRMVDVGGKEVTRRLARASGLVTMQVETAERIKRGAVGKGDVLELARVAGIMAAKRTGELIPLCHPLPLDSVNVDAEFVSEDELRISSQVTCTGRTGVEMEALQAVSTAALTVYDMCKSVDRSMTIGQIQLEEKSGGKSGHYVRGL
ncbi:MAG: cyclic pyranopterin monophosphate synthase MoaC [Planctomycetota bacterium]